LQAARYHRKGEIMYEKGRFEKARVYYERAADLRRRNI